MQLKSIVLIKVSKIINCKTVKKFATMIPFDL